MSKPIQIREYFLRAVDIQTGQDTVTTEGYGWFPVLERAIKRAENISREVGHPLKMFYITEWDLVANDVVRSMSVLEWLKELAK